MYSLIVPLDDHIDLTHRYWVFKIFEYEASGGLHDIALTTNSLKKSKSFCNDVKNDRWSDYWDVYIYDNETKRVIKIKDED